MSKPREFWIAKAPQQDIIADQFQETQDWTDDFEHWHVIEYSAFEQACKERDEMAKKFREVFGPAGFKSVSNLMEERDALKAELETRKWSTWETKCEELENQADKLLDHIIWLCDGIEHFDDTAQVNHLRTTAFEVMREYNEWKNKELWGKMPDNRWREKYYDKVDELNKSEVFNNAMAHEIQKLRADLAEAVDLISDILIDPEARKEVDSLTAKPAQIFLTKLKGDAK